jgi:hypothetical protein
MSRPVEVVTRFGVDQRGRVGEATWSGTVERVGEEQVIRRGLVRAGLLAVVLIASLAAPASAYIDGGSTTILFQTLVAGTAAAGLSARLAWNRLRSLGGRRAEIDSVSSGDPVASPPEEEQAAGE